MTRKLIVVANMKKVKFYSAHGLKLEALKEEHNCEELSTHHEVQEKRQGFFKKRSQQSHFFDPHHEAVDLLKSDFSKIIVKHLKEIWANKNFDKLIIIAEPKILGFIRKNLDPILAGQIIKEVAKDLVNAETSEISYTAFT